VIEVKAPFPFAQVDMIDEFLLEVGDPRWMVSQDLPTNQAMVMGVFGEESEAKSAWAELQSAQPVLADSQAEFRELADQDWKESYKLHFKPWRFGRLHWVPVWERSTYAVAENDVVIWLDPGLAFGTGNHETTRLCCERLVEFAPKLTPQDPIIDAGCGSGILALSAARLGFVNIEGFDNDPEAVRVSNDNADLNGLSGTVKFFTGDLASGLGGRSAKLVLANIQADILMRFVSELVRPVQSGGALILSGILAREIDQVRAVFAAHALQPDWQLESRQLGEWCDLALFRS
jgi:ribosomal protein L11 methyltransferase